MNTAVIGHRGTGKSELIKRLQVYIDDESVDFIDLDTEIEKKIGKTIPELFLEHGESYFRNLEKQLFFEILQKPNKNSYIVLGAGFDVSVIPSDVKVLWVKRKTDLDGRIFLNRPRLNPELSPLDEFRKRARERELNYRLRADEIYLMPEGEFANQQRLMQIEKSILTHTVTNVRGIITVSPDIFTSKEKFSYFKYCYANSGIFAFELRDDWITWAQANEFILEFPDSKIIYSFRKLQQITDFLQEYENLKIFEKIAFVDWAWELGEPTDVLKFFAKDKIILSLHDAARKSDWEKYEYLVGHMKYAPEIFTFTQIKTEHGWQSEKPNSRSFLPRSANGRWEWYRLLQKDRQLINFWKEGEGSAADQPSLASWLMTPSSFKKFAAVLGDPIFHSFTPLQHSSFFYKKNMPVFAITVSRDEWNEAIEVLRALGLTHAAVTSPHKENAAKLCGHKELKAVNTLYWDYTQNSWIGTSTDEKGFVELIEGIGMIAPLQHDIAVWGGGGTLETIKKALPYASYFSSRTGKIKDDGTYQQSLHPKIVVWAAPRSAETVMPPSTWKPVFVYDLNYKEDSMGREYAQLCQANYQSGIKMFEAQALAQKIFWSQFE